MPTELHRVIARRVMDNVARIRKEKDLSQHQFADIAGITSQYMSQLESGIRDPSLEMVCRFAEVLKMPLEQLIKK